MAITYFGAGAPVPGDTGSNVGASLPVNFPASMVAGDLCIAIVQNRTTGATIAISETGGQAWSFLAAVGQANITGRAFWCRFNGTWTATPTADGSTDGMTTVMFVFRPTVGANTWAIDVAQTEQDHAAPSSPFNVTVTGRTAIADSTVTFCAIFSADDNSWGKQAGNTWVQTQPGGFFQIRNVAGQDQSLAAFYWIATVAGAVPNCGLQQILTTGDASTSLIVTFKEVTSGPAAYELIADPGAFVTTGVVATLAQSRSFIADPTGFATAGNAATLSKGFAFVAAAGSFATAGAPATVSIARVASAGAHSTTGAPATLARGLVFDAASGSHSTTGNPATFVQGYAFNAVAGAYSTSGNAAIFTTTRVALPGSFTATGLPAILSRGLVFDAAPGAYATSAPASAVLAGRGLAADAGSMATTGLPATFTKVTAGGYDLAPDPGVYATAGAPTTFAQSRALAALAGAYQAIGVGGGTYAARAIGVDPGAYTATGLPSTLTLVQVGAFALTADPGAYSTTGVGAGAYAARGLTALAGSYSTLGSPAVVFRGATLAALAGAYATGGLAAIFATTRGVGLLPGAYAVFGIDAGLVFVPLQTVGDGWHFIDETLRSPDMTGGAMASPVFLNESLTLPAATGEGIGQPEVYDAALTTAEFEEEVLV